VIQVDGFYASLRENNFNFFTGVPDSLLKDICAYITQHSNPEEHVITANEGAAVGLAAGYHLATGKIPVVYMQNSGFGNTINPLLSLADPEVYSLPILFVIGWRGEPGVHDEPQHVKQGRIMEPLMKSLEIGYSILDENSANYDALLKELKIEMLKTNKPHVLLIKKGTFSPFKMTDAKSTLDLGREQAIHKILAKLDDTCRVISTTGMISREVYEYRQKFGTDVNRNFDFMTVGSMGHASLIALGLAMFSKNKVICMDGDGSILMHMGSLTTVGQVKPENFIHIVLNNGAHDSVGGQPTCGHDISFTKMAQIAGYTTTVEINSEAELDTWLSKSVASLKGPVFVNVNVKKGNRADLGRPKSKPIENKINFMKTIHGRI